MTNILLTSRKQFRSVSPAKKMDRDRKHSSIEKRYITFEARSRKYRGQSYPTLLYLRCSIWQRVSTLLQKRRGGLRKLRAYFTSGKGREAGNAGSLSFALRAARKVSSVAKSV